MSLAGLLNICKAVYKAGQHKARISRDILKVYTTEILDSSNYSGGLEDWTDLLGWISPSIEFLIYSFVFLFSIQELQYLSFYHKLQPA